MTRHPAFFFRLKRATIGLCMLRRTLKLGLALGLAAGLQSASAFTLGGPGESWQTAALGYEQWNYTIYPSPEPIEFPNGWIVSISPEFSAHPMNLGEEYR